jgi:hypothetical protein
MSSSPSPISNSRFELGFNDSTLATCGAAILLFAAVVWTSRSPNVERTDFSLTYVGAKIVHHGMSHDLYDTALQKQVRDSLFQHPVPLFFEHPPFEALLLSPLASYSFRAAYLIWGLMNATIWLSSIFALRQHLHWPGETLGYVILWLVFAPLWVALYQGQSSLLLLAAYALTFVLLKRGSHVSAGIALGFGLFKFQFVLPFVLIFLLRKQWRFLAGFAVTALGLALISIAGVGWKGVVDYGRFLSTVGNNPQNISYGSGMDMPTIHGFVFAVVGRRITGTELNIIVGAICLALLAWIAMRWNPAGENPSFDLMFATALTASLLSGFHMFTHDFSPLILAMLVAAGQISHRLNSRAPSWARAAIWTSLTVFWTFPAYFLFVKWHCLYLMCPVLLLFATGTAELAKNTKSTVANVAAVTG